VVTNRKRASHGHIIYIELQILEGRRLLYSRCLLGFWPRCRSDPCRLFPSGRLATAPKVQTLSPPPGSNNQRTSVLFVPCLVLQFAVPTTTSNFVAPQSPPSRSCSSCLDGFIGSLACWSESSRSEREGRGQDV
jgi:hypothetical protein